MAMRSSLALLAMLTMASLTWADEHCCTWSPGDPVNLKSPYRSILQMLGFPCPDEPPPAVDLPPASCEGNQTQFYRQWCGYPCDFWFSADAAAFWMKGSRVPPL